MLIFARLLFLKLLLLSAMTAQADAVETPGLAQHPEVQGALATLDAWLLGTQTYEQIPGVSVGIVADQTLLFEKGYGYANVRGKVPADADTIYSICSISKLFTSIGVMQLRDAGELALRDPVAQHLAWYDIEENHPHAGPARIHGLLTHSSGLPRESDFPYWSASNFPFPDRQAMMTQLAQQATLYPADTRFQYSNLGITLAGEIIAARSGRPYAEYIRTNVLNPLGLDDTRPYFPQELHGKQMAIGYSGKQRDGSRTTVAPFDSRAIAPAAGFTSTVKDLAGFASWQFRLLGGEGDDAVLDANTLREMQRVHWVDDDWKTSWGLGFVVTEVQGSTLVGHTGGCPGYITSFMMVPKYKLAAIALTNAADGNASDITAGMLRVIGPALQAALGEETAPEAAAAEQSLVDLSPYVGNFSPGIWGGEVAVRVWGEQLALINLPSDNLNDILKLKHVVDDEFVRVTDDGEEREPWVFERGDNGEVAGLKRHSFVLRRID